MLPSLAFAFDRYFRVALDGAEHLPTGPAIYFGNHCGSRGWCIGCGSRLSSRGSCASGGDFIRCCGLRRIGTTGDHK